MELSYELISQFAKQIVKNTRPANTESTVYGTVVTDSVGNKYVKLDGSDQLTPLSDDERPSLEVTSVNANEGDRVSVLIKNHMATVTGNMSSPAARDTDVKDVDDRVTEVEKFDILLAEQVMANEAYFKKLIGDEAVIGKLIAAEANITELIATRAEIDKLIADKITVTDLIADKIDADVIVADKALIESLKSSHIDVLSLIADRAVIDDLIANKGTLQTLIAENIEANYANIDFANISELAVEKIFADSGIIKDLIVSEGKITGELVGVTIKGNLIEAGTLVADKLVVRGSNGKYYKLNTDFTAIPGVEPDARDSIHGSTIIAKSIVAEQISVDDLVAFGAKIAGFTIAKDAIHSDVKDSIDNTTRGIYLGKDGQINFGDASNFIKYYKDAEGKYKLEISASEIKFETSSLRIGARNLIRNSENLIFDSYSFGEPMLDEIIAKQAEILAKQDSYIGTTSEVSTGTSGSNMNDILDDAIGAQESILTAQNNYIGGDVE